MQQKGQTSYWYSVTSPLSPDQRGAVLGAEGVSASEEWPTAAAAPVSARAPEANPQRLLLLPSPPLLVPALAAVPEASGRDNACSAAPRWADADAHELDAARASADVAYLQPGNRGFSIAPHAATGCSRNGLASRFRPRKGASSGAMNP